MLIKIKKIVKIKGRCLLKEEECFQNIIRQTLYMLYNKLKFD